jgi:hypothetical protein
VLTRAEARRIAANIAKLPEVLQRAGQRLAVTHEAEEERWYVAIRNDTAAARLLSAGDLDRLTLHPSPRRGSPTGFWLPPNQRA